MYTLTKIYRNDKNKEGNPLIDKRGNPYKSVVIGVAELPTEKYITGFDADDWTASWKAGDQVDIEIYEKEWNGQKYKNFKKPSETSRMLDKLANWEAVMKKLEETVKRLEEQQEAIIQLFPQFGAPTIEKSTPIIEEKTQFDDLPF